MHNIFEKLHVRSRTEAAALALWPREREPVTNAAEPTPLDEGAQIFSRDDRRAADVG
jgi:hypothetical protein